MPTVLVQAKSPNENEQKFEVEQGQIIFDELERQGLVLPHGCLAGSCGSCRIEILEGAEKLSPLGAVEADTIDSIKKTYCETDRAELVINKNIRLSCRAKVLGDIKISVLK
ncbi:MAG: 2Fe-2S iron-sulfur cluster-binding protein [Bacteriovorax sp.]|nr:2Fe-2S iron-sulfur cluster-binding protein [Bacteriovorax sp.]